MVQRLAAGALSLLLAAVVSAQEVKLVGATAVNINVSGEEATHAVFFSAPDGTTADITPIGPLTIENKGIKLTAGPGPGGSRSIAITIKPNAQLERGKTYTGALVFAAAGKHLGDIPLGVSYAAAAFSADAVNADICLACGSTRIVPVRVRNTGTVTIEKFRVAALQLHTADHDWRAFRGGEAPVVLAPNESKIVNFVITPPLYAGTYAGSIEISAAGTDAVKAPITIRTRGPYGGTALPFVLFFTLLFATAMIARALEHYFGSSGGEQRDLAVISLEASQRRLSEVLAWIDGWDPNRKLLAQFRGWVANDLFGIGEALKSESMTPQQLATVADNVSITRQKRNIFQRRLEWAVNDLGIARDVAAAKLQAVSDAGDSNAYDRALGDAVQSAAVDEARERSLDWEIPEVMIVGKPKRRLVTMRRVRRWSVIMVSLASGFLALYYGKCAFGTAADYITTGIWGFSLTAAGTAVLREGKAEPPAPT